MGRLILITGGVRSGKSDFAQRLATTIGGDDVVFIATAEAKDDEMARRIARHREGRPAPWRTVEAPTGAGRSVQQCGPAKAIVVDCLTLLVSNVVLSMGEQRSTQDAEAAAEAEVQSLIAAARGFPGTVLVVTNEVGWGIVPANALARLYGDLLGRANARLAHESEQVYLMLAGVPVEIKKLASHGGT